MELPDIDLEQLRKNKEKNFQERLDFIRQYAAWVNKVPNSVWSRQQKDLFE